MLVIKSFSERKKAEKSREGQAKLLITKETPFVRTDNAYLYSTDLYGVFSPLNTAYRSSDTAAGRCALPGVLARISSHLTIILNRNFDHQGSSPGHEFEEEETEAIGEPTMEEYMTKTRDDYGSGIIRHKIDDKARFELKVQFLKELRDNTFSGLDNEDANDHIEKVLEIVDLFHIPEVTQDQIMLRVFPMSLTGATSRWLRNEPVGLIDTWETLKKKFLSKYCPPA
ncbi:hypothetical protein Tco_0085712 [Tanacetum coccineum]